MYATIEKITNLFYIFSAMKKLLLLVLFVLATTLHAQQVERIMVKGQISAPVDIDIEGVTLYNNSANKGTVTDVNGEFTLEVALNDEIVVSALQYAVFKVKIDQRTIDTKKLSIYLNPVVNELTEVTVYKYDLTGNLIVDIKSIKTVDLDTEWDISYENVEFNYEFAADKYSSIPGSFAEDAFYNGQQRYGANLLGGIALFSQYVLNKKRNNSFNLKIRNPDKMVDDIRERFSHDAIKTNFNIPEGKEDDFLYYAEDNGFTKSLMLDENELRLFSFLEKSAVAYLKHINE